MQAKFQRFLFLSVMLSFLAVGCVDTGAPKRKERARDPDDAPPAAKPADKAAKPAPGKAAPPAANTANKAAPATPAVKPAPTAATAGTDTPAAETAPTEQAPEVVDPVAKLPSLPSAASITIDPVPLTEEWSADKKMMQTELRMQKIVLAMMEYTKQNGRMLPEATTNPPQEAPLLSWRVALLPFLGHEELYQKFRLKEPWLSPNNKKLLKEMPPEYQSPWSPGLAENTVFLAPRSVKALFGGDAKGRDLALITDEWTQTVALLMVDDARAVPWIQPADYKLRAGCSPGMLGKPLGGFLGTLASGETKWFPLTGSREKFPALFTINGGEKIIPDTIVRPGREAQEALVKYALREVETVPKEDIKTLLAEFNKLQSASGISLGSSSSSDGSGSEPAEDNRAQIPDEEKVASSKAKLKKAFADSFKEVKPYTDQRLVKQQYAIILLDQLENVQSDPVDAFVLLDTARRYAMDAGDFSKARQATEELTQRYKVETFPYKIEYLKAVSDHLLVKDQNAEMKSMAREMLKEALARDDFNSADDLYNVLRESVFRSRGSATGTKGKTDGSETALLPIIQKEISDRRTAYKPVPEAMEVINKYKESIKNLPSPPDPKQIPTEVKEANLTVGKYHALVKMDWKTGSPYLKTGNNIRLKVLAELDSGPPADPKAMAELADEYMAYADIEVGSIFKRGLKFRAVYWYQQALPNMPPSLNKVQAEKHVEAVKKDKEYKDIFDQALEAMEGNGGGLKKMAAGATTSTSDN